MKIGEFMYNGSREWKNVPTVTKDDINEETEHSISCFLFHMQARAPTFDMKDSREYPAIESPVVRLYNNDLSS